MPCIPATHITGCIPLFNIEEPYMSIGTILLIVLVLVLVGALPSWPHSQNWGYYPSGIIGLIVVILLILLLMGRL
jgi:uncharacterized membrane protein YkgB